MNPALGPKKCAHNTSHHDYATPLTTSRTLRTDRVCDACGDTIQSFYDSDEEDA